MNLTNSYIINLIKLDDRVICLGGKLTLNNKLISIEITHRYKVYLLI